MDVSIEFLKDDEFLRSARGCIAGEFAFYMDDLENEILNGDDGDDKPARILQETDVKQ